MRIEDGSGRSRELKDACAKIGFGERVRRSLKSAGLYLGLALCSLPIPGLHFFLVPSFLILSLYFGRIKFKETSKINLAGELCPSCDQPIREAMVYFSGDSLRIYCYECRTQLKIS